MKKITVLVLFVICVLTSFSQKRFAFLVGRNTSEVYFQGDKLLPKNSDDFNRVGAVSLGDAGESMDGDAYLSRFGKVITHFSTHFSDSSLILLIKKNEVPLISCYAFTALVSENRSSEAISEIMSQFAEDTHSTVYLDWGCSSHEIPVFDYMMSILACKGRLEFMHLKQMKRFDQKLLESFLEKRKEFHPGTDALNREVSWEDYRAYYLNSSE